MDSRYKFYLDGQLLETEPRGWDDITFFIKRDKDFNGLLTFIDVELEFFKDGYDILTSKLYSNGFCDSVELVIEEACGSTTYKTIHKGLIKLSKCIIDEKVCSVTVNPDDNSFYARIDKNRSLKAFPWVGLSKNGVEITPAELLKLQFFKPSDGTWHSIISSGSFTHSSSGYRVYEIFRYLLAYMTDDEVEFDSTLFGIGGDFEGLMLTSGTVLFTVQSGLTEAAFKDTFPDVSFEDFYKEVSKKLNLGFYIDYSGLKPKMWIERAQDIPTGSLSTTLDNVYAIKTKVDTSRLYNTLKIGSTIIENVAFPALQFPEGIDWLGFKEETYNILGDCGVDTELDLVSDYIISSNAIENAVETPANTYEGELFLIDAELYATGIYRAIQTNNLTTSPPYYYNQSLTNSEVAKRYYGYVPSSIAKFLGNADNTFHATKTSVGVWTPVNHGTSAQYGPIAFEDDSTPPNLDPSNVFNNSVPPAANAATFICPSGGIYSFSTHIELSLELNPSGNTDLQIFFAVYDASDTFLYSNISPLWQYGPGISGTISTFRNHSATFFLNTSEKVKVFYIQTQRVAGQSAFRVMPGSTFECSADVTGGGIYQTNDPKDYIGLIHEFEYNITETMWQAIKSNPRGNIKFAQANQDFREAIIDSFQFNKNAASPIKLIRSINQ